MSGNLEQVLMKYYFGKLRAEREAAIQKMKSEIFFKELMVGISFVIKLNDN